MNIAGTHYRSVWVDPGDGWSVHILDQTRLPWQVEILRLTEEAQAAHAIPGSWPPCLGRWLTGGSAPPVPQGKR